MWNCVPTHTYPQRFFFSCLPPVLRSRWNWTQLLKITTCGHLKAQLFENDSVFVFEKLCFSNVHTYPRKRSFKKFPLCQKVAFLKSYVFKRLCFDRICVDGNTDIQSNLCITGSLGIWPGDRYIQGDRYLKVSFNWLYWKLMNNDFIWKYHRLFYCNSMNSRRKKIGYGFLRAKLDSMWDVIDFGGRYNYVGKR